MTNIKKISNDISLVVHDLQTPISAMKMGVEILEEILPKLILCYKKCKEDGREIYGISDSLVTALDVLSNNMSNDIKFLNSYFRILGEGTSQQIYNSVVLDQLSVKECFELAKKEFICRSTYEKNILKEKCIWIGDDCVINGNKRLMRSVFLRLFINAVFNIRKTPSGFIQVSSERYLDGYKICFLDTTDGFIISDLSFQLDSLIERFRIDLAFGLHFCFLAVNAMNGSITYSSEQGRFNKFVLIFN